MSTPYDAPLTQMRAAIAQAAAVSGLDGLAERAGMLEEITDQVLDGAAKFAREVLSPLNPVGDHQGCRLEGGRVVTPAGFAEAYRRFCEDGWPALAGPEDHDGAGLPAVLSAAATEMWGGANLAFAMCTEVAVGAAEALEAHADEALKDRWLPGIVSGEVPVAMALTEPQAGSDLAPIRTIAEPDGDTWLLRGSKIYISWGDHDFSDNLVHLVLARTPDAPEGLRGLSLFLVPAVVDGADGQPVRNDMRAASLEHKMGIRASPTCTMAYGDGGGARAWLVGGLHQGLSCMFTMMNTMRLGVALHSTGLAGRACQLALEFSRERVQGRGADRKPVAIIEHVDVRRMLLTMHALTHAARCLAYTAAATLDVARSADDEAVRTAALERAGLLTPLAKAWCSDTAVEVASLGVQVHGGTGYVDDAEISQLYRDARIGPIFEGTNYIQAQGLVGRGIVRDRGRVLAGLLERMRAAADALPPDPRLEPLREGLTAGCDALHDAANRLIQHAPEQPELIGATAADFLQWLGVLAGAWQWALAAGRADEDAAGAWTLECAAFYGARVLPRANAHAAQLAADPALTAGPSLTDW